MCCKNFRRTENPSRKESGYAGTPKIWLMKRTPDTLLKNVAGVDTFIALIEKSLASVVATVDISNTPISMLPTIFETTIFSPLSVWTEEQGTVNCPIVAVMLTLCVSHDQLQAPSPRGWGS